MNLHQPPVFTVDDVSAGVTFRCGDCRLRILFYSEAIARITSTEVRPPSDKPSRIVLASPVEIPYTLTEDANEYRVATRSLVIYIEKSSGALRYTEANGRLLVKEPPHGGKWLRERPVYRNVFDRSGSVDLGDSVDGARAAATAYRTVFDRDAFQAKLEFVFSSDEALFGFGSHEEGFANLRGRSRELYQQNMKAVVPHLVSTRGYSLLFDCGSAMTFHDDALGSYWWADCVDQLDFYFIQGETYREVLRGYRTLTGCIPLPPRWAFGYVQSKERYVTAVEMLDVVAEYRRREIPLDAIVLDWKSWPNGRGWGQKSLDPLRFPDPAGFVRHLHAMHTRLMVSIWPIMTGGCDDQRELLDRGLMLGNNSTYDAFNRTARDLYWQQARRGLLDHGVDAWWCDCTEPFEADWTGSVKPEPHERFAINTSASKLYLDDAEINLYSLAHSEGIYENQRRDSSSRVLNLTRSSYAGQSRYGTFTWNGDVCATWETLRRSIAESLNFCATGEPYWTTDIGGFFLDHRPDLWFWRGDYSQGCRGLTPANALTPDLEDTGCQDLGFHELYTRWLQWAVFLPMFRSHGTDAAREIWRFGEPGSEFYDAIADAIRLRYQLLPYIYSTAAAVTFDAGSMVTALALAFPQDAECHDAADQFLFGAALMVCPVTIPMFYIRNSSPLTGVPQVRQVYLPASRGWYNFATGRFHEGGRSIEASAPLAHIPVFIAAGSILPLASPGAQYVDQFPDAPLEVRIYAGCDGEFTLYEDDGTTYAYEQGSCSRIHLDWNDGLQTLNVSARQGVFDSMIADRDLLLVLITPSKRHLAQLHYTGAALRHHFEGIGSPAQ